MLSYSEASGIDRQGSQILRGIPLRMTARAQSSQLIGA